MSLDLINEIQDHEEALRLIVPKRRKKKMIHTDQAKLDKAKQARQAKLDKAEKAK